MYLNIKIFNALAMRAFRKVTADTDIWAGYSLNDVLSIFEYYFGKYEDTFKAVHPNIRMVQIERIIERMPFIDNETSDICDIAPEAYYTLIDKHFQTRYRNCDYNINHFFSGDIRLLRFYEELY